MPEPIEYSILTNLRDALTQIRISDGYHYDVRAIAVKLDPNQDVEALIAPDGPRPFVVLEVLPERRDYSPGQPSGRVRVRRPVTIHWVSASDPTRDADRMQVFFRGCADIERAIAADGTRGGLALDTRILRGTFDTAVDGSQVWAMIETEINGHVRDFGQPDGAI